MSNGLLLQLQDTLEELRRLLQLVQEGRAIEALKVSDESDQLTGFRAKYQARLLTRVTGTKEEFAQHLTDDIRGLIRQIISLIDYVQAHGIDDRAQIDVQEATERYNERAAVLDRVVEYLDSPRQPFDDRETLDPTKSNRITETITGKSEREIFQIVSRTVPVEPGLDEECSTVLAILIRWAHQEPAILSLIGNGESLVNGWYEEDFRDFAGSQELRDYVGPYFTAFIKKALSPDGVEAYDEAFRNLYFAVVNRVINFYETYQLVDDDALGPPSPTVSKPNVLTLPNQSSPARPKQSDTSENVAPLPPLEGAEPIAVKTLLTKHDAEEITHEDLDSLPGPVNTNLQTTKKIQGTGLE